MNELLQNLMNWIALHPMAFTIAVFFVALMESLVVLGLLIPGAALLFGAGALMATGTLPIATIMLATIGGAIVGDFISFMLGRYYHQRLRVIWPFRRYPVMVNRGVDFFVRHGGKSVFMARFIGPLRPIVPAIAGMMRMSISRFLVIDIIASALWAPVYILPGMVFGASLGLAAEVAGRLVVLLVVIAAIAWLGIWIASTLIRLLQPHIVRALEKLLEYSRNHPRVKPLAGSLLDSDHPEARGLATLSALFFVALWLLLLTSRQVLHGHWMNGIDAYLFHSLENLRTPWADQVMVFITQFGNQALLALVLAGSCAWLFWKGNSKAAWHWLAAYASVGLLTWVLKSTVQIARPLSSYGGYSFPSAHTSMSLAVYGFLALIIARELHVTRRWLPYSVAGLLVTAIALSRLYLGIHWFSDVFAGALLGLIWVALLGLAYDRHPAPRLPAKRLLGVATLLLVVAGSWQTQHDFKRELAYYSPTVEIQRVTLSTWTTSSWEQLPAYRMDLDGVNTQPMNFQWAGTLESLKSVLQAQGWISAPALRPTNTLNWLAPDPDITALPILPQVNDGQHQSLLLVAPQQADKDQLVILRLWPSDLQLINSNTPIWSGKAAYLLIEKELPLITYLRTGPDFEAPLELLTKALGNSTEVRSLHRIRPLTGLPIHWQGNVLLTWETDR
jgi:membrane protein DedA with SNARE-associated domain/membrane-associated phospholipid phosphatase